MRALRRTVLFAAAAAIVTAIVACGGGVTSGVIPPKFSVAKTKTDHGVFEARWYVTLKNDGGPGSQLVQFWVGSKADQHSRTTVYSERHELGFGESKTITVVWKHDGAGALWSAIVEGRDTGVEFLP